MSAIRNLDLILFLNFYLVFIFLVGLARRVNHYHDVARLALSSPGRWPNLLQLVREHHYIFLTWSTVGPALLAGLLSVVQMLASYLVWPQAHLSTGHLGDEAWWALLFIVPFGVGMVAVDLYGVVVIGQIDRPLLEKHFDLAEYWLRSRTAHVVRVVTLGYVNPRKMVSEEVRKALTEVSQMLNTSLWWMVVSLGLRVAFGLSVWLTWALTVGESGSLPVPSV